MVTFEILLIFGGVPLSVYTFCRFIGLCNNVAKIRRALDNNFIARTGTSDRKGTSDGTAKPFQ